MPTQVATPEPPPEPVAAPAPVEPAPAPEPKPVPPPKPEPRRTAILLSDDLRVFASVAEKLGQRLEAGGYTVHNLDGNLRESERVIAEISESDADQLVAIGLLAAKVGRRVEGMPMVFCQVFNYRDHDLIAANSKGVNLLPPFDKQLEAWRNLSPDLQRIGVIAGPNQEDLIAEISAVTEQQQVELLIREATSDQEALYQFKRLATRITGLWLLPDNRILSPRALREIMAYSAKHRNQVVVFGPALLELGALMSVTNESGDVADQVVTRLERITSDGTVVGPDMLPLTRMQLQVNPEVAQHLGLVVSEQLASTGGAR